VNIAPLVDFDATISVRDIEAPQGVTILTDAAEVLARVQAPRVAEEPVVAAEAPVTEAAETAETTEVQTEE
jgi:hypothetical protein